MSKLLKLFKGRTLYEQQSPSYSDSILEHLVHLDTAGAYASRDAYFLFDSEGVPVEPIVSKAEASVITGSPLSNGSMSFTPIEVHFGNGNFMAISARSIWRRNADGSWDEVYTESDGGALDFQRIAYGGGRWVAGQGGDDSTSGKAFVSTDDGDNWTSANIGQNGRITAIVHRDSTNWLIAVWHAGNSLTYLARSTDGAATFAIESSGDWASVMPDGATFPDSGATPYLTFMVENYPPGFGKADGWILRVTDNFATAYWQWSLSGVIFDRDIYRFDANARRVLFIEGEGGGRGTLVVMHSDGRVNTTKVVGQGGAQNGQVQRYSGITESGGSVSVRDAAYDPVGKALLACGSFTPTGGGTPEARAWRSTDLGKSWTRMDDVELAMVTSITTVAVDDQGDALFLNGTSWTFTGTTRGLAGGQYNVYVISYFNSPAGRVVYDIQRTVQTTEDGGSIGFTASGKDWIQTNNTWMPSGFAAKLRFDVYVQLVAESIGEEGITPENTIRYAFTEPFPDGSDEVTDIDRSLDELPLGRQAVSRGLPTTAVFEKRMTAVHQGRVWGLAHQDETEWQVENDGISPEIANQFNRFVLCYTETGWANFMSDQSFIPIQPTQSSRFTGLISTPMGLLVCFDNEIHVVTGDPAFDNVTVELFTDLVGNDYDQENDRLIRPAKVGGMPFVTWNGKIWALSQNAQDISESQWLSSDPFIQIVPEPQNRSLLALTQSGLVFRFIIDKQFWFTDAVTGPGDTFTIDLMLPNCVCESGDNTRFLQEDSGASDVYATRRDGEADTSYLQWGDIDFGVLERRKALHLVKAGFEGSMFSLGNYDRGDPGFDPAVVPNLFVFTNNDAFASIPPVLRYPNSTLPRATGVLNWRTPVGVTKGDSFALMLVLNGVGYPDSIRLPVKLYFSSGGELR